MDRDAFIRDVIAQGGRLGLTPLERFALIIVSAILIVLGERGWRALVAGAASLKWTVPPSPFPPDPDSGIPNDTPGNQPGPQE